MNFRSIGPEDLEQLRVWRNTPEINRWCRQHTDISKQDQIDWFERQHADPAIKMFVIEEQVEVPSKIRVVKKDLSHISYEDRIVGVCGLTSINGIALNAEFSLYIGPEYQNQRLGSKALVKLLKFGFDVYNLNLIWGECFEQNPAMKMFEKIGFQNEGTRRQFYYKDGKYIDAHLISITRQEFRAKWSVE